MSKWNPLFPVCLKKSCKGSNPELAKTKVLELRRERGESTFECGVCGTVWRVTEPGSRLETVVEEVAKRTRRET
jgi:hypothetical protein